MRDRSDKHVGWIRGKDINVGKQKASGFRPQASGKSGLRIQASGKSGLSLGLASDEVSGVPPNRERGRGLAGLAGGRVRQADCTAKLTRLPPKAGEVGP
jgi:hypothetical protein